MTEISDTAVKNWVHRLLMTQDDPHVIVKQVWEAGYDYGRLDQSEVEQKKIQSVKKPIRVTLDMSPDYQDYLDLVKQGIIHIKKYYGGKHD